MLVGLPRWCRCAGVAVRALAYRCCVAQALYHLAADALPAHHPSLHAPTRPPFLPKRRQARAGGCRLVAVIGHLGVDAAAGQ